MKRRRASSTAGRSAGSTMPMSLAALPKSVPNLEREPAYCILSTTREPFFSVARCACPVLAAPSAVASTSASSACRRGASIGSRRAIACHGRWGTESWSEPSARTYASGSTSARLASTCPILTYLIWIGKWWVNFRAGGGGMRAERLVVRACAYPPPRREMSRSASGAHCSCSS
eukprot:scaffold69092_cov31-Tisochrysis_lutea.AAC.1